MSRLSPFLKNKWDVVVIGSGIGGLTVAALLATEKRKRVLVLEKHLKVGGCTHSFQRRKDYIFDVGVHYVGGVSEHSILRKALSRLTQNRIQWKELPRHLDQVHLPDGDFAMSFDWSAMMEELTQQFPNEAKSFPRFFRTAKRISDAYVRWQTLELLPSWLQWLARAYVRFTAPEMFETIESVLDQYFKSDLLKLLLARRWLSYGLPANTCSFGIFAGDLTHFSEGGWYPLGGGERIAEELRKTVEDHGGAVVTGCRVDRIAVDHGHVTGVTVGSEFVAAESVISGAGAWSTYNRLLDPSDSPYHLCMKQMSNLNSYVMVFLSLDRSPRSFGINTENHWFFANPKCSPFFPDDPELNFMTGVWLGSPSLKRSSSSHTLEIITLVPIERFDSWRTSEWRRRPVDYENLKMKLYNSMMEIVERRFPGLKESVLHFEVSTPLTVEHFVNEVAGGLGIPATPDRLYLPWARSETPVRGLFLTGSDVFAWGISGALAGGLKTYQLMTVGRRTKNLNRSLQVGK